MNRLNSSHFYFDCVCYFLNFLNLPIFNFMFKLLKCMNICYCSLFYITFFFRDIIVISSIVRILIDTVYYTFWTHSFLNF